MSKFEESSTYQLIKLIHCKPIDTDKNLPPLEKKYVQRFELATSTVTGKWVTT